MFWNLTHDEVEYYFWQLSPLQDLKGVTYSATDRKRFSRDFCSLRVKMQESEILEVSAIYTLGLCGRRGPRVLLGKRRHVTFLDPIFSEISVICVSLES